MNHHDVWWWSKKDRARNGGKSNSKQTNKQNSEGQAWKCENFTIYFCRIFLGKFIMLPSLELFLFLSNIVLLLSWEERRWVRTEPSGEIVEKINISFIFSESEYNRLFGKILKIAIECRSTVSETKRKAAGIINIIWRPHQRSCITFSVLSIPCRSSVLRQFLHCSRKNMCSEFIHAVRKLRDTVCSRLFTSSLLMGFFISSAFLIWVVIGCVVYKQIYYNPSCLMVMALNILCNLETYFALTR